MTDQGSVFNPPPGWPQPPDGWTPPKGWEPDPAWPDPPEGWPLWTPLGAQAEEALPIDDETRQAADHEEQISEGPLPDIAIDSQSRLALLEAENASLRSQLSGATSEVDVVLLDDERILQDVGIYRYHHPLENASAYKGELKSIGSRIADLVRSKEAIEASNLFTYDNSLAKGRKLTNDLGKLMLRAYNAEADNSLRSLRAGNVQTAKKRIDASRNAIKKLGSMMELQISEQYHSLRHEEIELTADYLMKKQEEREDAREERARLREEKKVAEELAAQREKLNKEKSHLLNALEALHASGSTDADLEEKLKSVEDAIEQNDYRAANVRAGYVYVISNRGAFGEDVVKIGLTRRLEPMDRVKELGDASVPFRFDVHCLFFSEDAVSLENQLHEHFSDQRVNFANARKEFFFATPTEVLSVLQSKIGNILEFTEAAESTEFLQSLHYWPAHRQPNQ